MRSRYRLNDSAKAHFVTCTVVEWLPVFTSAARCDILTDSLAFCREHKGLRINGWVIMDNHFHAILGAPDLSRVLADFKRHTARRLFEQLERERQHWLLNQLAYFRLGHKTTSAHQFWQEGSHPQAIHGDEMMLQKLEYIANKSVRRGWVVSPEHWRFVGACQAAGGVAGVEV